ncbi:uncharacterized protein NECHADRAFT_82059 [Fusarium vanettenii 77-13-4]|uniref:SNF2 N-terminal domain-containing protein n=1 Tax=Fusarium vanettenii (strain ATCC MYA-4622 / CBS 123669 / FGSC 9596 / NRRL 45880 / 77-13-4) TaxID=660122 RepID=C7ZAD3_FUSV7|nr:uncharacterized protein NECHADRAFT_82059 [Fusarium vanettenii 77-13-4]EEU39657.1 predicted protein [Fusarium vanettenii 77-13-4]
MPCFDRPFRRQSPRFSCRVDGESNGIEEKPSVMLIMFQMMRSFPKRFDASDLDPEQSHQQKRRRSTKKSEELKVKRQNSNTTHPGFAPYAELRRNEVVKQDLVHLVVREGMKNEERIGFHRMVASKGDEVVDVASCKRLVDLPNDSELPLPVELKEDPARDAEATLCSRTTYIITGMMVSTRLNAQPQPPKHGQQAAAQLTKENRVDLRNFAVNLAGEQRPGSDAPQHPTNPESSTASRNIPCMITEYLPETGDLQEICGAVGIPDWEDLRMNEHQPLRILEPSQVIDAFVVHQKVNSAPHCALLANECGSGMAGIEMSVRIRQQGLADESVRALSLAVSWKPTLWLCPFSILSQLYAEISDFWGGLFRVYCLHSQSHPGRDETVLRTTEELQELLKHLAEEQSPAVARAVIISSYDTAVAKLWRKGLGTTNDEFSYLVLDGAHCVKNPRLERHKFIRTIKSESFVLIWTTPIADITRDMVGYAKLIWDPPYPLENDDWISPETWYDDRFGTALLHGKSFGNIESCCIFLHRPKDTLPESTSFEPRNQSEQEYLDAVRAGRLIFLLNLTSFAALARKTKFSAQFSLQATRKVLQMVTIQRGMNSSISLPDGITTSLGQRLSGLTVFQAMLRATQDVERTIMELTESFLDRSAGPDGLRRRSPDVRRRLSLISMDVNNHKLTFLSERFMNSIWKDSAGTIERYTKGMRTPVQCVGSKRKAEMADEDGPSTPTASASAGTSRVDRDDQTGGVNWGFLLARDSP